MTGDCFRISRAARSGDLELVRQLVEEGSSVNCDSGGVPLVSLAVESGNTDLLAYLLDKGADIEAPDRQLFTPLCYAAQKHNASLVEFLLGQGANVNQVSSSGYTAVMLALAGDQLYNERRSPAKRKNPKLEKTLEVLVQHGADLDVKGPDGYTALHFACAMFPLNLEVLVKAGADVNIADHYGMTVLMSCKGRDVKLLLEHGADPLATNRQGKSAMFFVSTLQKAKALKRAGLPIDGRDQAGSTALMEAVRRKVPFKLIEWFAGFPELADARDNNNNNALMMSAISSNTEALRFLITVEDPLVTNGQGNSLLMQAVNNRDVEQLVLIVEAGCDVNLQNQDGDTALHKVAKSLNPLLVDFLLGCGADASIRNKKDLTAMSNAIDYCICSEAILKKLISAGANDVQSAFDRAVEFNKPEITIFLQQYL